MMIEQRLEWSDKSVLLTSSKSAKTSCRDSVTGRFKYSANSSWLSAWLQRLHTFLPSSCSTWSVTPAFRLKDETKRVQNNSSTSMYYTRGVTLKACALNMSHYFLSGLWFASSYSRYLFKRIQRCKWQEGCGETNNPFLHSWWTEKHHRTQMLHNEANEHHSHRLLFFSDRRGTQCDLLL